MGDVRRARVSHQDALEKELMSARDRERDYQQRIERLERERDELARDWDKEHDHRLAIQRSEEALAAQVERLREALSDAHGAMDQFDHAPCSMREGYSFEGECEDIMNLFNETPAQSLREIRAEAGREGVKAGISIAESCKWDGTDPAQIMYEEAERYAQQIREGKE